MRSCGSAAPSPKSRHHSRHRLRGLRQEAPAARVPTHTRAPGSGAVVVGASIVPASKAAAIFSIDGFMVRKPHSRIEAPGCQVPARRLESRRRTPRISLKNELKSPSECQRARRENATVEAPRSRRRWRGGRDRATWTAGRAIGAGSQVSPIRPRRDAWSVQNDGRLGTSAHR